MAHAGSNPYKTGRQNWRQGGHEAKTLAGAYTLTDADAQSIAMDPGGAARVVTLPAEEDHDGAWFEIYNSADAAEAITIANDAAETILVLKQGESGKVGCTGAAWVVLQAPRTAAPGAAAITTTRVLTLADAGGVFSVSQAAAYDIDLPSPTTGPGSRYLFYLTGPAANAVTITVAGAAATFVGTIANDVTSVLPATGATLTFASGAAALGDTIEIISISTTLYLVRAISSAAGGITIA